MRKVTFLYFVLIILLVSFFGVGCSDDVDTSDTTPPIISISSPLSGSEVGSSIIVRGSVSDSKSDIESVTIFISKDGSSVTNSYTNALSLNLSNFSAILAADSLGDYIIFATAIDTAGNQATSSNVTVTVAAVPVLTVTSPTIVANQVYTNTASFDIAGTATIIAGATITNVTILIENSNSTNLLTDCGTDSWSSTLSLFAGNNTIKIKAYASNGKVSQETLFTVFLDTINPTFAISSPTNNQEVAASYFVSGTATDNDKIAAVYLKLNDESYALANYSDGIWSIEVTNAENVGQPYTNTGYAVDRSGNKTGSTSIIVAGTSEMSGGDVITNIKVRVIHVPYTNDYEVAGIANWTNDTVWLGQGENYITATAFANNGKQGVSQTLKVILPVASTNSGMGAIPFYNGGGDCIGVTFRVWAPHATAVAVAGNFNSWSATANPMANEGNGYWSIDTANATLNSGYKFVITYDGNLLWKNDPYAREVTTSVGNSIVKDRRYNWSGFTIPGHHQMVIYEMHPKTWVENVAGSGSIFSKIASKAGYLKDDLAINAVELLPVAEFPGDYSWGYNPAHLFAVESSYGGYTAYKDMVNSLHQNGIAVIQDVVHNHYGPSDLDLWCFDGPSLVEGKGGIYFFTDWRQGTPWGDSRPDYGRGEVRAFIKDNGLYWINEMNADGLRWDATVYIRKTAYDGSDISEGWTLLQWVNNEVHSAKGGAITIAEDLQNNSYITKSTGDGGLGYNSQWHADFLHSMREQLKQMDAANVNMNEIKTCIDWVDNGNNTSLVKYTESHDECAGCNGKQRMTEDIWSGNARSYYSLKKAALGLLTAILSPGIPMIFQGQENLETGNWSDNINFSWDDVTTYTNAGNNYIHMIRDAIRLKRNWYNQTAGLSGNGINVWHVNDTGKVIAFHRWMNGGAGDDVVVIINFSNTRYPSYELGGMPGDQNGEWKLRYNSDWKGTYVDWAAYFAADYPGAVNSGHAWASSGKINIQIGPYTVLIYSQD